MGPTVFYFTIFISIAIPSIIFVSLLLLPVFEKEYDYLALENKKIRLEKQLKDMEYMQLSQQIRPHFLFNAINAMLSLARLKRLDELIKSMESFSMFFRHHYKAKEELIPFKEEFEYTKNYLQIQEARFGKRLNVDYHMDPMAIETFLPPYMLQTFVENAFKHGLERKTGERKLTIDLTRDGAWVSLKVIDNGVTFDIHQKTPTGTGLHNIRRRLELLFDVSTELTLTRINDSTIVEAYWPYSPEGME